MTPSDTRGQATGQSPVTMMMFVVVMTVGIVVMGEIQSAMVAAQSAGEPMRVGAPLDFRGALPLLWLPLAGLLGKGVTNITQELTRLVAGVGGP